MATANQNPPIRVVDAQQPAVEFFHTHAKCVPNSILREALCITDVKINNGQSEFVTHVAGCNYTNIDWTFLYEGIARSAYISDGHGGAIVDSTAFNNAMFLPVKFYVAEHEHCYNSMTASTPLNKRMPIFDDFDYYLIPHEVRPIQFRLKKQTIPEPRQKVRLPGRFYPMDITVSWFDRDEVDERVGIPFELKAKQKKAIRTVAFQNQMLSAAYNKLNQLDRVVNGWDEVLTTGKAALDGINVLISRAIAFTDAGKFFSDSQVLSVTSLLIQIVEFFRTSHKLLLASITCTAAAIFTTTTTLVSRVFDLLKSYSRPTQVNQGEFMNHVGTNLLPLAAAVGTFLTLTEHKEGIVKRVANTVRSVMPMSAIIGSGWEAIGCIFDLLPLLIRSWVWELFPNFRKIDFLARDDVKSFILRCNEYESKGYLQSPEFNMQQRKVVIQDLMLSRKLYKEALELYSGKLSMPLIFSTAIRTINKIGGRCKNELEARKGDEQQPFWLALAGGTGVGKSTIANSVAMAMYAAAVMQEIDYMPGESQEAWLVRAAAEARQKIIYWRASGSKHWDNYANQFVVGYDDFNQGNVEVTGVTELLDLFELLTSVQVQLPMASLEDKGMTFRSPMVITTSNETRHTSSEMKHFEALARRQGACFKMSVKREYGILYPVNGQNHWMFNPAYEPTDGEEYTPTDQYLFQQYNPLDDRDFIGNPIGFDEMIVIVAKALLLHTKRQMGAIVTPRSVLEHSVHIGGLLNKIDPQMYNAIRDVRLLSLSDKFKDAYTGFENHMMQDEDGYFEERPGPVYDAAERFLVTSPLSEEHVEYKASSGSSAGQRIRALAMEMCKKCTVCPGKCVCPLPSLSESLNKLDCDVPHPPSRLSLTEAYSLMSDAHLSPETIEQMLVAEGFASNLVEAETLARTNRWLAEAGKYAAAQAQYRQWHEALKSTLYDLTHSKFTWMFLGLLGTGSIAALVVSLLTSEEKPVTRMLPAGQFIEGKPFSEVELFREARLKIVAKKEVDALLKALSDKESRLYFAVDCALAEIDHFGDVVRDGRNWNWPHDEIQQQSWDERNTNKKRTTKRGFRPKKNAKASVGQKFTTILMELQVASKGECSAIAHAVNMALTAERGGYQPQWQTRKKVDLSGVDEVWWHFGRKVFFDKLYVLDKNVYLSTITYLNNMGSWTDQDQIDHLERDRMAEEDMPEYMQALLDKPDEEFMNQVAEGVPTPTTQAEMVKHSLLKLYGNAVHIGIGHDDVKFGLFGLGIVNNLMLTIGHLSKYLKEGDPICILYRQKKYNIFYRTQDVTFVEGRDLAFWRLPKKAMPMFTSIVDRFLPNAEHDRISRIHALVMSFNTISGDLLYEDVGEAVVMTEPNFCRGVSYIDGKKECTENSRVLAYAIDSAPGSCGSWVAAKTGKYQGKVLAMHVGGDVHGSVGTIVIKEDIERAIEHFKVPLLQHIGMEFAYARPGEEPKYDSPSYFNKVGVAPIRLHNPTKTGLEPSLIYDLAVKHIKEPSVLHANDPRLGGTNFNPFVLGQSKYNHEPKFVDQSLMDTVADFIEEKTLSRYTNANATILTYDEALNGLQDEKDSTRMNIASSTGFPYKQFATGKGKTSFIHMWDINGMETNDSDRLVRCTFRKEVYDAIEAIDAMMRQGAVGPFVFIELLKDEIRELTKIKEGKTRLFMMASLDLTVLMRVYMHGFAVAMQKDKIMWYSALGIDPESTDWNVLATKFLKKSNFGIDIDYKDFDGNVPNQASAIFVRVMNAWYTRHSKEHPERVRIDNNVRELLMESITHSTSICQDAVHQINNGNKSGQQMTTNFNNMTNFVFLCVMWLSLAPEEWQDLKFFDEFCSATVYGDDVIMSVSGFAWDFYNGITIKHKMKEMFNINVTSAAKDGSEVAYKELSELTFLKRNFHYNTDWQMWVAQFKWEELKEIVNWVRKSDNKEEQTILNIEDSLALAVAHGEEKYNSWRNEIIEALRKKNCDYVPTSYRMAYYTWYRKHHQNENVELTRAIFKPFENRVKHKKKSDYKIFQEELAKFEAEKLPQRPDTNGLRGSNSSDFYVDYRDLTLADLGPNIQMQKQIFLDGLWSYNNVQELGLETNKVTGKVNNTYQQVCACAEATPEYYSEQYMRGRNPAQTIERISEAKEHIFNLIFPDGKMPWTGEELDGAVPWEYYWKDIYKHFAVDCPTIKDFLKHHARFHDANFLVCVETNPGPIYDQADVNVNDEDALWWKLHQLNSEITCACGVCARPILGLINELRRFRNSDTAIWMANYHIYLKTMDAKMQRLSENQSGYVEGCKQPHSYSGHVVRLGLRTQSPRIDGHQ